MNENNATQRKYIGFWLLLALVAGILILGDLNRRMSDARRLELDGVVLQTQVADLEADQDVLRTQIAGATGEPLVGPWARSEAKMVQPGEVLVVPLIDPAVTPTPMHTATPADGAPSNWEIWRALLTSGG